MTTSTTDGDTDPWADWLLRGRYAGNPEFEHSIRAATAGYADRVLDGAHVGPGQTLLDIGTGDGLVAYRAIDRVGPSLHVILTDISAAMLAHAQATAEARGIRSQCEFIHAGAERLPSIADGSVDVVTTRSVLAYVADKPAALREFHRVLKRGGRLSMAEPLLRDEAVAANALRRTLEGQPANGRDLFMTLLHRWKAAQFPDTEEAIALSPIVNYTERDLLRFVHDAGFRRVHLELHIDVGPSDISSWDVFVKVSPHPGAPPLESILATQFTADERRFFEAVMRPSLSSSDSLTSSRMIYVTARKA